MHTDEVYFRDTAKGFLTWAIASLLTAAMLSSVVGSIIGGGLRAGTAVAGGTATAVGTAHDETKNTIEYSVDSLFCGDSVDSAAGSAQQAHEVSETPSVQSRGYSRARCARVPCRKRTNVISVD